MHHGQRINIAAFEIALGIVTAEGSMDEQARQLTFIKTSYRLRASQIEKAITEYNSHVTTSAFIFLAKDPHGPFIVTAAKGSLSKYSIYSRICKDREASSCNYWFWSKGATDVSLPMDTTSCPDALCGFEAQILGALTRVSGMYQDYRHSELLEMESDFCCGLSPQEGCVYVAVSRVVRYPKIGATRRSDPSQRLKELSLHVPSPFRLAYCVPTFTPFSLESEIHAHFSAFRIREKGACSEFFNLPPQAVGEHLKANYEREFVI